MNRVILIGRFTKDVELKSTPQGTSVCTFTLAVDRRFQKQGTERQADFISCVAWRNTADFISKYFRKGDPICVEGSIQSRSWDGTDGQRHYVTEVVVENASFLPARKNGTADGVPLPGDPGPVGIPGGGGFAPMDDDEDGLPF